MKIKQILILFLLLNLTKCAANSQNDESGITTKKVIGLAFKIGAAFGTACAAVIGKAVGEKISENYIK